MTQTLEEMVKEAVARFEALPPHKKREHIQAQRRSWVIGEMMLEHPALLREHIERLCDRIGL